MSYRNPVSCVIATLIVLCALTPLPAQTRTEYAVILTDPPLAGQLTTRRDLKIETPAKAKLIQAQSSIRRAIESRHIRIRSSAQILVNAIFIDATEAEAQALRSIPGVSRVEREAPLHRELTAPST